MSLRTPRASVERFNPFFWISSGRPPLEEKLDFRFSNFYQEMAKAEVPLVLRSLHSSLEGLTLEEVSTRLKQYGRNEIFSTREGYSPRPSCTEKCLLHGEQCS